MSTIKRLRYTPTTELQKTLEQITDELERRRKQAESLPDELLVQDLPIRANTRSTLFRAYKQNTQAGYLVEKTLTLRELMLQLPPGYWLKFKEESPRLFDEFRDALRQKKIYINQVISIDMASVNDDAFAQL
ncbi:hypothetical protein [Rudanella lutea]|jgi:hypothetical protein|uniref:hypothetical protein n=1 Tax=Rudanella lutea TaxID=451374 RepID=UPI00036A1D80|nr:hypothetical protein [Rudanella lutea]